uniref:Major coat protein n=1 Tax=Sweet potato chlorotic stunt virus TaxID=81931 RepID=M1T237_9CLOS|nr:major coat protein [Sweet potato chlorotic stunt virus]
MADSTKVEEKNFDSDSDLETNPKNKLQSEYASRRDVQTEGTASLGRRDMELTSGILTSDQLALARLGKIQVYSNSPDIMSKSQEDEFKRHMENFAKVVTGEATITPEIFAAFYASLIQAWANQSTSEKNASNVNLENMFMVDGKEYSWKAHNFINHIQSNMPDVKNAIRKWARAHANDYKVLVGMGIVKPDYHLQAKQGVLPEYWHLATDFMRGNDLATTADGLAATLMMKRNALCNKDNKNSVYNVTQLTGTGLHC